MTLALMRNNEKKKKKTMYEVGRTKRNQTFRTQSIAMIVVMKKKKKTIL